jgi:uncharacterized protein
MTPPHEVDGHLPGSGPWILAMRWERLLFAHWRIPLELMRSLLPDALEIDAFDGSAWLGLVPFRMARVHPRLAPVLPGISDFPEVNVRTYVRCGGRPGVWFFSLDASDRLAVRVARSTTWLPYHRARMSMTVGEGGWIDYRSERSGGTADLACRYRPTPGGSRPGLHRPTALETFLTARDGLWTLDHGGRPHWLAIRHINWPLVAAELEIDRQTLTAAAGMPLDRAPEQVAYSHVLDVRAWRPMRLAD